MLDSLDTSSQFLTHMNETFFNIIVGLKNKNSPPQTYSYAQSSPTALQTTSVFISDKPLITIAKKYF
jgi:hypothetical protein